MSVAMLLATGKSTLLVNPVIPCAQIGGLLLAKKGAV